MTSLPKGRAQPCCPPKPALCMPSKCVSSENPESTSLTLPEPHFSIWDTLTPG